MLLLLLLLLLLQVAVAASQSAVAAEKRPLAAPRLSPAALVVTSHDQSVSVTVDEQTGAISSVTSRGKQHAITGVATLEGTIPLQVSVKAVGDSGGSVQITRTVCIHAMDVPCTSKQAQVTSLLSPRAASIGWTINISSPTYPTDPTPLWSAPFVTNITFASSGDKQFWAPWSRSESRDPLLPSDGGFSWWTGEYLLGAQVMPASDHVIHEMATVLDPTHDSGVSFIPSPANPPAHPTWLNISGSGMDCRTADACSGSGWFAVSRHHLRFGDGAAPHVFDADIVAHEACWRAALGWSAQAHEAYWEPVSPVIKEIEGLGSYSSYLGELSDPKYKAMGYALNWDLSGRFFPYAGQFLPCVRKLCVAAAAAAAAAAGFAAAAAAAAAAGFSSCCSLRSQSSAPACASHSPVKKDEVWLNDGEGTQPRANVTFDIINDYYGRIQRQGYATLSYDFLWFNFVQTLLKCG